MLNLILIVFFCVLFGIFPIYLFLKKFELRNHTRLILSFGFSSLLLAVINSLIVILGIETSLLKYTILILPYFLSLKQIKLLLNSKVDYSLLKPIVLSVLTGLAFCYFSFPDVFELIQKPHADVEFNLGLIQELKSNFLPHDPYWFKDDYLIYHFLGNMFMASLSNFIDINILSIYNYGNIFIALNLFTILGLMAKKKYVSSNLTISLIFLLYSVANKWVLFDSFHAHISTSASTFYWSLPIFFASLILWEFINKRRKSISFITQLSISFILIFSISFSKGSFIFPFLMLEFISFIVFVVNEKIYSFQKIKQHILPLLSFLIIPSLSILCAFLLSFQSNGASMFIGMEYRDLIFFKSWSLLNPVLLIFTTPVVLFIITLIFSNNKPKGLNYILTAFFSFLMLFVITHEGFSDVYFGFNAILLILVFYLRLETSFKFIKLLTISFLSFQFLTFVFNENVKLTTPVNVVENLMQIDTRNENYSFLEQITTFNPNQIWNKLTRHDVITGDSIFYKQMIELKKTGDLLDKENVLMAINEPLYKNFKLPAYMEIATWNSCNSYAHSTINSYTLIREFLSKQEFFPTYAKAAPSADDYNISFENFKQNFIIDKNQYENPKKRTYIYNQLVYGKLSQLEIDELLISTKITHIYVEKSQNKGLNNWMKSLAKIEANTFVIYIL